MQRMSESEGRTNDSAHDVLAAEAFAVPAPDPELRHHPVQLPDDPTGIAEPHDILAAEEFALPAARPHAVRGAFARHAQKSWRLALGAAFAGLIGAAFRRRR